MLRLASYALLFSLHSHTNTHILSIPECVCIYFQIYFLFSDCLVRSFFQTNIYEENTFLFEQNANIGINVRVWVCGGGVFQATCKMIQLKAIAKRERTFWFSFKILTWNWNIRACMVYCCRCLCSCCYRCCCWLTSFLVATFSFFFISPESLCSAVLKIWKTVNLLNTSALTVNAYSNGKRMK